MDKTSISNGQGAMNLRETYLAAAWSLGSFLQMVSTTTSRNCSKQLLIRARRRFSIRGLLFTMVEISCGFSQRRGDGLVDARETKQLNDEI